MRYVVAVVCATAALVSAGNSMAAPGSTGASSLTAVASCSRGGRSVLYHGHRKCLSLALRKRIFRALVHWQDLHPRQDKRAYYVIAKRFRITVRTMAEIAVEGESKGWPI
jgi:hypothetical protein